MRSSTSSSESGPVVELAPRWLAAGFLGFLLLLAGGEWLARAAGARASWTDTPHRWARLLTEARYAGERALVIVGTSQSQCGLDPARLASALPGHRVFQLAALAASPLPVLEHLAEAPAFPGTVLLEVSPRFLYLEPESCRVPVVTEEAGVALVEARLDPSLVVGSEEFLEDQLSDRLRLLQPPPNAPHRVLVRWIREGRGLTETWLPRRDRYAPVPPPPDWPRSAPLRSAPLTWLQAADVEAVHRRILGAEERIRAAGGRVVLFRPPLSGASAATCREQVPRSQTWDRLVAAREGPAIHVEDLPEASALRCFDETHLAEGEARVFTEAMARALGPLLEAPPTKDSR